MVVEHDKILKKKNQLAHNPGHQGHIQLGTVKKKLQKSRDSKPIIGNRGSPDSIEFCSSCLRSKSVPHAP